MVNKASPIVSILLAFNNEERFIKRAVKSVLEQTYRNWELIILDDGSIDRSLAVIGNIIKNIENIIVTKFLQSKGKANALNNGLELAKGKYILELDGDDWLHKNALLWFVKYAEEGNTSIGLFYSDYNIIKIREGKVTNRIKKGKPFIDRINWINNFFIPTPRFYRKEVLKEIGGWEINYPSEGKLYEDIALILKLLNKYKMSYVPKKTMYVLRHNKSITYKNRYAWSSIYKYLLVKALNEWGEPFIIDIRDSKKILIEEKQKDNSKKSPLISLIVDYIDNEKNFLYLLQSIINQSYENIEVILLDNDSIIKTKDFVQSFLSKKNISYRVLNFVESNEHTLNQALELTKGKYIMVLPLFEILNPEAVEILCKSIENNAKKNIVCAYGNRKLFSSSSSLNFIGNQKNIQIDSINDLFKNSYPPILCLLDRKSIIRSREFKNFSKRISGHQCLWSLLLSLLLEGDFIYIPRYLSFNLKNK